jgi:hypothetical protein
VAHPAEARSRRKLASFALVALLVVLVGPWTRAARAADGSNDVCPAVAVEADDVRERFDADGRLVHQLRLFKGRVVQEIAISYRDGQAVARTEVTPGHRRIARTYFDGDRVAVAECHEDTRRVAYASYGYDSDGHVVLADKWTLRPPADGWKGGPASWTRETVRNTYGTDGQLAHTEVREGTGQVRSHTWRTREPRRVPIIFSVTGGGAYQSDTELLDFVGGLGIHREPKVEQYANDPLEVGLDATYRFHRVAGATSTDQTTLRLGADYHEVVPRIALFSFIATDRNVPANLSLNLELAVLGIKLDLVRPERLQLDVSFAPIWNYRSIVVPAETGPETNAETSKLRGSFRARAGLHFDRWSLVDTVEFLPTLFGDDSAPETDFWHRTVLRNTVTLEVSLAPRFTLRQVFRYTWDPAMRAQAMCPDPDNPLCRGYSLASTTAISVNLEL